MVTLFKGCMGQRGKQEHFWCILSIKLKLHPGQGGPKGERGCTGEKGITLLHLNGNKIFISSIT